MLDLEGRCRCYVSKARIHFDFEIAFSLNFSFVNVTYSLLFMGCWHLALIFGKLFFAYLELDLL